MRMSEMTKELSQARFQIQQRLQAGRVKSSSHKQKNRALKSSRIASSQSAKNRWRGPQDS